MSWEGWPFFNSPSDAKVQAAPFISAWFTKYVSLGRSSKLWAFCKGFDSAFPMQKTKNRVSIFRFRCPCPEANFQPVLFFSESPGAIVFSLYWTPSSGCDHWLRKSHGWGWWKSHDISPPGVLGQHTHWKVSTRETVFYIPSHVLLGGTRSSSKAKVAMWFCHIVAFALVESIATFFQVAG